MSHGHKTKHTHCEHCLHDCGPCDTAYCCKCSKEWVNCHRAHYSWWYSAPGTYTIPCSTAGSTISIGGSGGVSVTNEYVLDTTLTTQVHAHGHN